MADETNAGGLTSVILAASPGTPTLTCRKIADAVLTYMAEREAAAREQGRAEADAGMAALLVLLRSLGTGYSGGGNRHAYCIDPQHLRAIVNTYLTADRSAALNAVKAAAWDEGMRTGSSRAMRKMSDEPNLPLASDADNPYRADRLTTDTP